MASSIRDCSERRREGSFPQWVTFIDPLLSSPSFIPLDWIGLDWIGLDWIQKIRLGFECGFKRMLQRFSEEGFLEALKLMAAWQSRWNDPLNWPRIEWWEP